MGWDGTGRIRWDGTGADGVRLCRAGSGDFAESSSLVCFFFFFFCFLLFSGFVKNVAIAVFFAPVPPPFSDVTSRVLDSGQREERAKQKGDPRGSTKQGGPQRASSMLAQR